MSRDVEQASGEVTRPRHPYGWATTMKFALLDVASGLITLATAGFVQPEWSINFAFKAAIQANRRAAASSPAPSSPLGTPEATK